jgi:5'-nucleotidase / UDP-sugar diphosphatase
MKRLGLFAVFVMVAMTLGCSDTDGQKPPTIAIMATANLDSRVASYETSMNGETITVGGLDRIATAARKVRGSVDGSLLLSAGDDVLGSFYRMFQGEPEMEGMSLAGYDVVAPGTHEFDYGADTYKNALSFAAFDVVSGNLSADDTELSDRILPYVIKTVAGIRIGIFGLMTPDFSLLCNPPGGGVEIDPEIIPAAQHLVEALRGNACSLIICLAHIDMNRAAELAQSVTGIDLIIDSSLRNDTTETVNDTLIVQGGGGGEYLGVLRFVFREGSISGPHWERILLDTSVEGDPEIRTLMQGYVNEYEQRLGERIGESEVDLDARNETLRRGETNLGDLVADTWLDRFQDADIALVNSGSIRGNTIYPAGPITYLTLSEILPYRGEIVIAEMSGSGIRQALEVSASAIRVTGDGCEDGHRAPTGGFMQIGGLRIMIDLQQPPFCAVYSDKHVSEIINLGSRIIRAEVYQNEAWIELDSAKTYTVLVNDYIAEGGDGQYIFLSESIDKILTGMVSTDILADFIIQHTPISPKTDGRIQHLGLEARTDSRN